MTNDTIKTSTYQDEIAAIVTDELTQKLTDIASHYGRHETDVAHDVAQELLERFGCDGLGGCLLCQG